MRKALLVVLWGAAEALSGPGDLHLTITPTVTMGQTFEASWTWFSYQLPTPHMFVVALEGESYKKNFSISQAGFSGVIPLTVPNTGTLQATLVRTNIVPHTTDSAVATFFAMNLVSMPSGPASPSPRTPLPPSATPPSGTMSLPPVANPSAMLPSPSSAQTITQVTTTTAPASTQTALTAHHSLSPGILAGSIVGGLVAFLLLTLSATCIWRRCRIRRMIKQQDLYPTVTIPDESLVTETYWDGDSDLSSLAPSDSVSRAMYPFHKKIRPLAPSTTMTFVSEEYKS